MLDDLGSDAQLVAMRDLAHRELVSNILPFWEQHAFGPTGALRGGVTNSLEYLDEPPRHAVLAARILWTFSAAADVLEDRREALLHTAKQALEVLTGPMWDTQHGGVYWSIDAAGAVIDTRKQIYAQAFAIYGLARWARTTGDTAALDRARWLAGALDSSARDREYGGYVEALARDWTPTPHTALSDVDPDVPKSMNTNLHVLEALTELLRSGGDRATCEALETLLRTSLDSIVQSAPFPHCGLYFDHSWDRLDGGVSYGHDIEASWLLWDAWDVLAQHCVADLSLMTRTREVALGLAAAVREHGVAAEGAVMYAGTLAGPTDTDRHWWPQAEGVVGWLNAYQLGGRAADRAAAIRAWDFIETYVIDRDNGEWFARLGADNHPARGHSGDLKMGPWKCPYHNARACLEVVARVAQVPAYA